MKKLILLLPLFLLTSTKSMEPEQFEALKAGFTSLKNSIIRPKAEFLERAKNWACWEKNSEWPVLENSPVFELFRKNKQQQVKQDVAQNSQQ